MKDQFINEKLNGIEKHIKAIREHINKPEPKTVHAWWSGTSNVQDGKPEIIEKYEIAHLNIKTSRYYVFSSRGQLFVPEGELRFAGDDVYWDGITYSGGKNAMPGVFKIANINESIISITDGVLTCPTTPEHLFTTPIELARDEKAIKAIKAIKDSLDQRWSKIVKCETFFEASYIIKDTDCALCKVYGASNIPCPLKNETCSGRNCVSEFNAFYFKNDIKKAKPMYDLLCQKYKEYSGLDYVPEHPEPKFAKGQMTDRGKIIAVIWGEDWAKEYHKEPDDHKHWHYKTELYANYYFLESELTTIPSTEVTLFKVVDGEVETGNRMLDKFWTDKDEYAEQIFKDGFCAILITKDGVSERRYCPEIEALEELSVFKGWQNIAATTTEIKTILECIITHPIWTVESKSGQKLRAYRSKDGQVFVEIDGKYLGFIPEALIKPLGLEGHEMPYILHGKG